MIAEAAYFRAERRGFQGGCPVDDWLEAEHEISQSFRPEPPRGALVFLENPNHARPDANRVQLGDIATGDQAGLAGPGCALCAGSVASASATCH